MNLTDILGWSLGVLAVILTVFTVYYLYNVARSYGGKIGKAFIKLSIGIIFIMIAAIIMGATLQLDVFCGESYSLIVMVSIALPAILGIIAIFLGNRDLIKIAKG